MDMNRLPEGKYDDQGCEGSFKMFADLVRQRELKMSCREGRSQPVIFWAVFIILCKAFLSTAVGQHAFNGAAVEGHQQFLLQVVFPEYSQEMESLLGLLDHVVGVGSPRGVLCDVCPQELENRNPLHTIPVNVERLHVCLSC